MGESLTTLARKIRAEHQAAQKAGLESAEHACRAGQWLLKAKKRKDIPLGGWEQWVKEEAGVPLRTARHYVQLYVAVADGSATLPDIAEEGQKGALKLAAARKTQERREASRNAEPLPDGMDLRIGDCRIVLADIADNSIPLILTDPPYGDEAEPLYRWLAQWAQRVLIPGGSLICYTGQSRLDRDLAILSDKLRYWWLLIMPHQQSQRLPGKFVIANFKPVLWYVKDHRRGRELVPDMLLSPSREKDEHNWGQGDGGIGPLIEHLTDPGELILDPFAGTADWGRRATKMGRRWIGADIVQGGATMIAAE